jgi:hypothetical protein
MASEIMSSVTKLPQREILDRLLCVICGQDLVSVNVVEEPRKVAGGRVTLPPRPETNAEGAYLHRCVNLHESYESGVFPRTRAEPVDLDARIAAVEEKVATVEERVLVVEGRG